MVRPQVYKTCSLLSLGYGVPRLLVSGVQRKWVKTFLFQLGRVRIFELFSFLFLTLDFLTREWIFYHVIHFLHLNFVGIILQIETSLTFP